MHGDTTNRQMGFIAQELIAQAPETVFVDTSTEDNYHYVQYDRLTALLCEAIKELAAKVASLEAKIAG